MLYQAGYPRGQVNAVANFAFLTQDANLAIGKRPPEDYLAEAETKHPGVLASQWIPPDPALWRLERYPEFHAARRELLAAAANDFLGELRAGGPATTQPLEHLPVVRDVPDEHDEHREDVARLAVELTELGYVEPATDYEIADPAEGDVLAIADACWPEGLQPGQGNPIALIFDSEAPNLDRLQELGYEVFTSAETLREYIRLHLQQDAESATVGA